MANVALDIRANTAKALGEFKKLSRELDNKFLVQGLKLDVVKNALEVSTESSSNLLVSRDLIPQRQQTSCKETLQQTCLFLINFL